MLLTTTLSSSLIYAETQKHTKSSKKSDSNKTMTNEEFMSQFMALEQREIDAKAKTVKTEKDLEASKKLGKTLDEVGSLIGMKHEDQK